MKNLKKQLLKFKNSIKTKLWTKPKLKPLPVPAETIQLQAVLEEVQRVVQLATSIPRSQINEPIETRQAHMLLLSTLQRRALEERQARLVAQASDYHWVAVVSTKGVSVEN